MLPVLTGPGNANTNGLVVEKAVVEALFNGSGSASSAAPAASVAQAKWLQSAVASNYKLVRGTTRMPFLPDIPSLRPSTAVVLAKDTEIVAGAALTLVLTKANVRVPTASAAAVEKLAESAGAGAAAVARTVHTLLACRDPARVAAEASASGGAVRVTVDGCALALVNGTHFFTSPEALLASAGAAGEEARASLKAEVGEEVADKLRAGVAEFASAV